VRRCCVIVSERCRNVHADIQPHLHDAVDRTLERLFAVPYSDAARISVQHVGRHQRAAGLYLSTSSCIRRLTVTLFLHFICTSCSGRHDVGQRNVNILLHLQSDQMLGLVLADFGRDLRSSDSLRGSRNFVFFYPGNNARFQRFPIRSILRHFNTTTSIREAMKTFGTKF